MTDRLTRRLATALLCGAALAASLDPVAHAEEAPVAQERLETRPALARAFERLDTRGVVLLMDEGRWIASDAPRAFERFLPASTFKIPSTLIALESGVTEGPETVFRWDGQKRWLDDWNRDQTLVSAFRVSAVWVFQDIARRVGQPRMQQFLYDFRYGNAIAGPVVDRFWLDGALRISAVEQIDFLRRLNEGRLALSERAWPRAKAVMLRDEGPGWKLYAKTGWADAPKPAIGWYVGWLEHGEGLRRRSYFALNMDMTRAELGPQREAIVRAALREMGWLPAAAEGKP